MAGDPAIRWQVMADLLDAPAADVAAERARTATHGWGAALLALQDPDGRWAQALYSPKFTSTTYTLLLLQRLGLPSGNRQALAGVRQLWDGAACYSGGLMLAPSVHRPEACITAMIVRLTCDFGLTEPRLADSMAWLLGQQLPDGGWNCRSVRDGSRHGSFHTTLLVLEALAASQRTHPDAIVDAATARGRGFLLAHRLCRSHHTGQLVDPRYLRFPFPPGWRYDVVRALEHFIDAGADWDDRLTDGLDAIRAQRLPDGRWKGQGRYSGRYWATLEPAGPSRWATLRALRVVRWHRSLTGDRSHA